MGPGFLSEDFQAKYEIYPNSSFIPHNILIINRPWCSSQLAELLVTITLLGCQVERKVSWLMLLAELLVTRVLGCEAVRKVSWLMLLVELLVTRVSLVVRQ
jgi:hypothetical protein